MGVRAHARTSAVSVVLSILPAVALPLVVVIGWTARPVGGARAAAVDARQIYQRDCAVCHGGDAKGTTRGPTLDGWGRAGVDYALTTGRMPLSDPDAKTVRRRPAYDPGTIAAL